MLGFDSKLPSQPVFLITAWYYIFSFCDSLLGEILYFVRDPLFLGQKQTNKKQIQKNKSIPANTLSQFMSSPLGIMSLLGHGLFACSFLALLLRVLHATVWEPHLFTVPSHQAFYRAVSWGTMCRTNGCPSSVIPAAHFDASVLGPGITLDLLCLTPWWS